jgi:hypothetical protein
MPKRAYLATPEAIEVVHVATCVQLLMTFAGGADELLEARRVRRKLTGDVHA